MSDPRPAGAELLSSWADGAAKAAIVDFLQTVTDRRSADYVEPASRVAVFDNDGTLWPEKPMVIQLDFTVRRLAALAAADPGLRHVQPYRAAHERDMRWLGDVMTKHSQGDDSDLKLLMAAIPAAFESVSVEAYDDQVLHFFADAGHPMLGRPYLACGYLPMIELLRYLEANLFTTYIASGGDRDFMRPIAGELYGIPPERVIGSALGLRYHDSNNGGDLLYKSSMDFFDDGPEKPIRIWSRIGRRPILAVGNSDGDLPMLTFAGGPHLPALRILIQHDDLHREFDYTAGAEQVLEAADARGWNIVSMKNDWTQIFNAPTATGQTGD